ncbi:hypothetical protein CTEN210_06337 [Chaetoceros tenuissimus]|uniref:HORMA domain-containing protein n=1 Tax=Chaetoceros tenuissimus TaxID=426638 RepID=A0AAD3H4C7_9STRA|nr:hypothetical protein CTEN210_06337 [Chaetoceros tenuissimus]
MKAASTKTRVRQSVTQEQATAQAIGFLHNTIQHGLATICHSRNIFPESYFHNAATSQNETDFAIFRNDVDSLKSCNDGNQGSSQDSIEKLHPTENPDLPLLSPLTQFDFTQTQACSTNEHDNTQDTSIHHELTERQHAVMKAELKLLRHWLDGLYDVLKQDESRSNLERIIFAIHHLPLDEGESESCESYSFDVTAMQSSTQQGSFSKRDMELQFQKLFCNLQSYMSISSNGNESITGQKVDHFQRYLTFRLEFKQGTVLPHHLDPNESINRQCCTLFQDCQSTVKAQMKGLEQTTLGNVSTRSCLGIGLEVNAFTKVDEHLTETQSGFAHTIQGDASIERKRRYSESSSPSSSSCKRSKSSSIHSQHSSQSHSSAASNEETLEQKSILSKNSQIEIESVQHTQDPTIASSENIIPNGSLGYALPLPPPNVQNDDEYKANVKLVPCKVLDHRMKNSNLQYKVLFTDHSLLKRKQWITDTKVFPREIIVESIIAEVETVDSNMFSSLDQVIDYVLDKLPAISPATIKKVVEDNFEFQEEEKVLMEDNALRRNESETGAFFYFYAMNPITVVL